MSSRAAWRLEALGFVEVYDYAGGKADWLAAGLTTEGPGAAHPRAGAVARRDVATCGPEDSIATARARVAATAWERCVVINNEEIVAGLLDERALASDQRVTAGTCMRLGPSTVRADEDLTGLLERMHARNVGSVLVTDPDGRLLGVLSRQDGDEALTHRAEGAP